MADSEPADIQPFSRLRCCLADDRLEEKPGVTGCLQSSINNANSSVRDTVCQGGFRHCKMYIFSSAKAKKE